MTTWPSMWLARAAALGHRIAAYQLEQLRGGAGRDRATGRTPAPRFVHFSIACCAVSARPLYAILPLLLAGEGGSEGAKGGAAASHPSPPPSPKGEGGVKRNTPHAAHATRKMRVCTRHQRITREIQDGPELGLCDPAALSPGGSALPLPPSSCCCAVRCCRRIWRRLPRWAHAVAVIGCVIAGWRRGAPRRARAGGFAAGRRHALAPVCPAAGGCLARRGPWVQRMNGPHCDLRITRGEQTLLVAARPLQGRHAWRGAAARAAGRGAAPRRACRRCGAAGRGERAGARLARDNALALLEGDALATLLLKATPPKT